jgi:hypothetical protein
MRAFRSPRDAAWSPASRTRCAVCGAASKSSSFSSSPSCFFRVVIRHLDVCL